MSFHHLTSTKGGEALLLDVATIPGKVIHTTPSGNTNGDLLYLSVANLSSATQSLWFVIQGADVPVPPGREAMDRVDVPSSPTGIVRLTGAPLVLAPGYTLHISADQPAGSTPMVLYGYAERTT